MADNSTDFLGGDAGIGGDTLSQVMDMAGGGDNGGDFSSVDTGASYPFDVPYDPSADPYAAGSSDTGSAPAGSDPSQWIYDPATDSWLDPTSGQFFDASTPDPTASANDPGYIGDTQDTTVGNVGDLLIATQEFGYNPSAQDAQTWNAILGVDPSSDVTPQGWTDQEWQSYRDAVAMGENPVSATPSTAPVYRNSSGSATSGGGASLGGGSKPSNSQTQDMQALIQALAKLGTSIATQKTATPTVQRSLLPGQLTSASNPTSALLLVSIGVLAVVLIMRGGN